MGDGSLSRDHDEIHLVKREYMDRKVTMTTMQLARL